MEKLNDLVLDFLKQIKIDLSDPDKAFSQCKKVSIILVQYLQKHSIDADLIKVSNFLKGGFNEVQTKWGEIERYFWTHFIVRIGDIYVDLTWNQFVPGSPVPVYFTEEEVMEHWENYYVI